MKLASFFYGLPLSPPELLESSPVEPSPVELSPVESSPVEPLPVEPSPVELSPVEPSPVEPSPVEPLPVEPSPVELSPVVESSPVEVESSPVEVELSPADESSVEDELLLSVEELPSSVYPVLELLVLEESSLVPFPLSVEVVPVESLEFEA